MQCPEVCCHAEPFSLSLDLCLCPQGPPQDLPRIVIPKVRGLGVWQRESDHRKRCPLSLGGLLDAPELGLSEADPRSRVHGMLVFLEMVGEAGSVIRATGATVLYCVSL